VNARTRWLVGACLLGVGALTYGLAASQSQADVRYVQDVVADPAAHAASSFTLMGVPEPQQVPLTGPAGTYLAPNPEWANATRTTTRWSGPDGPYYSTLTLSVRTQPDGTVLWLLQNETRRSPADPEPAWLPTETRWTGGQAGTVFAVEAFEAGPGGAARIWAYYGKAPEHPLQPKPSQFRGHLMTAMPDGTPVPAGALIWQVDEYTAGCSSKFLPPAAREKYNVTA
jgi:hypothetical protein